MKELKSEVFDIEELEFFDVSGYREDREDRRERDSGNDSDKGKTSAWERVKDSSRWNSDILSHDRGRD